MSGLLHPVLGIDHLVAMLLVGFVSAMRGRKTAVAMPATFLAFLAIGGIAGLNGLLWTMNEIAIIASVLLLSGAVLFRNEFAAEWAFVATAVFGIAHGNAHGVEVPAEASWLGFVAGFMVSSLGLHIAGILISYFAAERRVLRVGTGLVSLGTGLSVAFL